MRISKGLHANQSGFTLVESLMALVLLSGGLLVLASALARGMIFVSGSHYHQMAKEKASEAMESVFTARDARKIPDWNSIQNVSQSASGIFLDGAQAIRVPGADGLVNTNDDGALETLPGKDGVLGTADDETLTADRFTREIEIRNIGSNLRQIRVIVRYMAGGVQHQYQLTSYISPFA
jgi:prepilin-type N-terminal cleavage/methylation domain-containing protein